MFTVIVPLYNKQDYILKCVNSILSQTYTQFELIIVNDGSTDNSLSIVNNLKDGRLRIISQSNLGVSTARNNGAKEAKYNYIAFIDADDWWDKHFLEEMKMLIEQCPGAGMYGSNFYIVKNGVINASMVGVGANFKKGYIDYINVYANNFCAPINCSFVILSKAVFLAEHGFNLQLKFGEDFDLWIRIALKYQVAYLNKALAYSNQDAHAESRALGINKFYPKESHYLFGLSYLESYEKQNKQLKKLIDGLRVRSLIRYYLNKKYVNEVKQLLSKVNFTDQPIYYRLVYSLPLPVIKIYFAMMHFGSAMKRKIIYPEGARLNTPKV